MAGTQRALISLASMTLALTGCQDTQRLKNTELAMQRMDEGMAAYGEHLDYMIDNAILQDMSVADMHFIAHTGEISGVGQARLERMAKLLSTYGGTVRYETFLQDKELMATRLDHVTEYLKLVGVDMSRVEVKPMMSGGRGMPGNEAVKKFRQGTAIDAGAGGAATIVPPSPAAAGG